MKNRQKFSGPLVCTLRRSLPPTECRLHALGGEEVKAASFVYGAAVYASRERTAYAVKLLSRSSAFVAREGVTGAEKGARGIPHDCVAALSTRLTIPLRVWHPNFYVTDPQRHTKSYFSRTRDRAQLPIVEAPT